MLDVVMGKEENCVRECDVIPEVFVQSGDETVVVDFVEDVDSIEKSFELFLGDVSEVLAVKFTEKTLEVREESNVDFELVIED